MRCNNCGWDNPNDAQVCAKCNSPLNSRSTNYEDTGSVNQEPHETMINLKGTIPESLTKAVINILENSNEPTSGNDVVKKCPNPECGYLLADGQDTCPRCGASVSDKETTNKITKNQEKVDEPKPNTLICAKCGNEIIIGSRFCPSCGNEVAKMGTINPWKSTERETEIGFQLTPIAWNGEIIAQDPKEYFGSNVILNRDNTDPSNNSITSKEQAEIMFEDGKWYIEDKSEQHTTMIQVNHKFEIHDGDNILLGNRLLSFKSN
ncbi:MAG: zinc ribbon domain-containing protein [Prevotellaceae bacterium]|nr:zinc ribbon domain-containing protein [Candidatus Colivivens equi]